MSKIAINTLKITTNEQNPAGISKISAEIQCSRINDNFTRFIALTTKFESSDAKSETRTIFGTNAARGKSYNNFKILS